MALRFENLVELYQAACSTYGDRPLFGTRRKEGWSWTTYGELRELIDAFRGGLGGLGIGEGDRIAIVADNCVEWAVACYATYGLAATFVPMYRAQRPEEWQFILSDCEARVVIAANPGLRDRLRGMQPELPHLEHVIGIEGPESDPTSFAGLLRAGRDAPVDPRIPGSETVAGFIYTSGTTGDPKGVILTHGNFASNVKASIETFRLDPDDRSLSFLPWAHAYGQAAELYMIMGLGASTAINDDVSRLVANLGEIKPTVFLSVPRVFNRIYNSVQQQVAGRSAVIRKLFRDGIESAREIGRGKRVGPLRRLELSLDERLIFARVRERFGGRLRLVVSAGAALNPEVAEFIDALGITVYEGYGLTETSPVVAINYPGNRKIGSVGKVIPGVRVEIRSADTDDPREGEIIVFGPNVMKGYHNRPEENAEVFTEDGGLRTGDLGYIDDDGFLYVTGRIKDHYKLENGRYVSPVSIEETLKLSPYVANVMVYGANRPYNVALISLDVPALADWARREEVELGDPAENERVHRLMQSDMERLSASLKPYEVPRRWVLTTDELTTENGMLTPTLKLRRRKVIERYGDELEELYRARAA